MAVAPGRHTPATCRLFPREPGNEIDVDPTAGDFATRLAILPRAMAAQADAVNLFKSRFLASVSHDLRQPLQSLHMLTAVMRLPLSHDERNAALDQASSALTVMSDLVNAVLNVSKLESGTVEPVIRCFALADLLEELRAELTSAAEHKGLSVTVSTENFQVCTDQVLLREIVHNLVANAICYTDRGQVRICAVASRPGFVEIAVEDTGIGIPPAAMQSIFEDFVQVPRPTDAHKVGVGLGLGTVRRIAELLNLPIQVDSSLGVGSRFTVVVPTVGRGAALQPTAPQRKGLEYKSVNRAVVFIDDDDAVRKATVLYLEKVEGYRVCAAASIGELQEMLVHLDEAPAIVISDYQLGNNMFGTDAIGLVRDRYGAGVPAIMMTGDTSAIAGEVIATSATALLNKPVDVGVLTRLMTDMIKGADCI